MTSPQAATFSQQLFVDIERTSIDI